MVGTQLRWVAKKNPFQPEQQTKVNELASLKRYMSDSEFRFKRKIHYPTENKEGFYHCSCENAMGFQFSINFVKFWSVMAGGKMYNFMPHEFKKTTQHT